MYFTLIFEDNKEGPSLSFDLVFHPCPVWYQGNDQIGIPEPRSPYYELGSVKFLLNILDEEFDKKRCNSVKIFTHKNGHGTEKDLETLVKDLTTEGFNVKLL